jgi:hypothetical protein
VIPATVTDLDGTSFDSVGEVEVVKFQRGSTLRKLALESLCDFKSLKSIIIPASVEILDGPDRFADYLESLESVTFEAGSKLREIKSDAFYGCSSLRTICVPASVESIEGSSFSACGLSHIDFERGNRFFHTVGDFVMNLNNSTLIRYFGSTSDIEIPGEVKIVKSLAFEWCCDLTLIRIPGSVEGIGVACFYSCGSLSDITLPLDSKLVRIEAVAFISCSLLQSLYVPSSVEYLGECCFRGCRALSNITFASPSHIRELLDLPLYWPGLHNIPDSVEMVRFGVYSPIQSHFGLIFGRESRLKSVRALDAGEEIGRRCFLQVASRSLGVFRLLQEYIDVS